MLFQAHQTIGKETRREKKTYLRASNECSFLLISIRITLTDGQLSGVRKQRRLWHLALSILKKHTYLLAL